MEMENFIKWLKEQEVFAIACLRRAEINGFKEGDECFQIFNGELNRISAALNLAEEFKAAAKF